MKSSSKSGLEYRKAFRKIKEKFYSILVAIFLSFFFMKNFTYIIFLLLTLASCIKNEERHGYVFDLSDHQLVQEGVTSKERVIKIMGSPTLISSLDGEDTWIYYSEDFDQALFFLPKVKERTIMTLKFDNSEIVNSVERYDLTNEDEKMKFAAKYTEVSSNKIGFFKSIFSNLGQVKAQ